MNLEKRHELVLLRLRYLKKELEYTKEIHGEASKEFSAAYKKHVSSLPEEERTKIDSVLNKEVAKRTVVKRRRSSNISSLSDLKEKKHAKRLFKEVAKVSHPDTIMDVEEEEREKKEKLFQKAQKAVDNSRYFDLIEIAEQLEVKLPPPTQDEIDLLKQSIKSMNNQIRDLKKTFAWLWYHDSEKRNNIMTDYIAKIARGRFRT